MTTRTAPARTRLAEALFGFLLLVVAGQVLGEGLGEAVAWAVGISVVAVVVDGVLHPGRTSFLTESGWYAASAGCAVLVLVLAVAASVGG